MTDTIAFGFVELQAGVTGNVAEYDVGFQADQVVFRGVESDEISYGVHGSGDGVVNDAIPAGTRAITNYAGVIFRTASWSVTFTHFHPDGFDINVVVAGPANILLQYVAIKKEMNIDVGTIIMPAGSLVDVDSPALDFVPGKVFLLGGAVNEICRGMASWEQSAQAERMLAGVRSNTYWDDRIFGTSAWWIELFSTGAKKFTLRPHATPPTGDLLLLYTAVRENI